MTLMAWDPAKHPRDRQGRWADKGLGVGIVESTWETANVLLNEVDAWPRARPETGGMSPRVMAIGLLSNVNAHPDWKIVTRRDEQGALTGVGTFYRLPGSKTKDGKTQLLDGAFAATSNGMALFKGFLEYAREQGASVEFVAGNKRAQALYDRMKIPKTSKGRGGSGASYALTEEEVAALADDLFAFAHHFEEWCGVDFAFDPRQPRHPKGTPLGGQWMAAASAMFGLDFDPNQPNPPKGSAAAYYQSLPYADHADYRMQFAELMRPEDVAPFMEFDRVTGPPGEAITNPEYGSALRKHIEDHGIGDPIFIDYNEETGEGHISEGHHRLEIARYLGLESVPVIVYPSRRSGRKNRPMGPFTGEILNARNVERHGERPRLPEYAKPSDFGLPILGPALPRQDTPSAPSGPREARSSTGKWARSTDMVGNTTHTQGSVQITGRKVSGATHTYRTAYVVRIDGERAGTGSSLDRAKELAQRIQDDTLPAPPEIVERIRQGVYHRDELWGGDPATMSDERFERALAGLREAYALIDPATDRNGNANTISSTIGSGVRDRSKRGSPSAPHKSPPASHLYGPDELTAEEQISALTEPGRSPLNPNNPKAWREADQALDVLAGPVYAADQAWEADITNPDRKADYKAAKARYRAMEKAAIDHGFRPPCSRCGGTGVYLHYGTCFRCMGAQADPGQPKRLFQVAPDIRHRRGVQAEAERLAREQVLLDRLESHGPDVAEAILKAKERRDAWSEMLAASYDDPPESMRPTKTERFLASLHDQMRDKDRDLTPKQVEAVRTAIARENEWRAKREAEAERIAQAQPLSPGRQTVRGTVVSTKEVEGQWGYQTKMLVQMPDGNKAWGTAPNALLPLAKGDEVEFDADLQPKQDDPHFAFYRKPTKAKNLSAEKRADDSGVVPGAVFEHPTWQTDGVPDKMIVLRVEKGAVVYRLESDAEGEERWDSLKGFLAMLEPERKMEFNPRQPRHPKGHPLGGQWADKPGVPDVERWMGGTFLGWDQPLVYMPDNIAHSDGRPVWRALYLPDDDRLVFWFVGKDGKPHHDEMAGRYARDHSPPSPAEPKYEPIPGREKGIQRVIDPRTMLLLQFDSQAVRLEGAGIESIGPGFSDRAEVSVGYVTSPEDDLEIEVPSGTALRGGEEGVRALVARAAARVRRLRKDFDWAESLVPVTYAREFTSMAWDGRLHPRWPKGTPKGGKFMTKGEIARALLKGGKLKGDGNQGRVRAARRGRPDVRFAKATPEAFAEAVGRNTRHQYLTEHAPEDLAADRLFLVPGGNAGFAITPDGDIQNVFRNEGAPPGAGQAAVDFAVEQGGLTLDAYDPYLPGMYAKHGFVETGRMKFDPAMAPDGWDFEKDDHPDVVFMAHGARPLAEPRYFTDWDEAKRVSRLHARKRIAPWREADTPKFEVPAGDASLQTLSPKGAQQVRDEWEAATGMPAEHVTENFAAILEEGADDEKAWRKGLGWYREAHDQAVAWSDEHEIPADRVAAAIALLSVQAEWNDEKMALQRTLDWKRAHPDEWEALAPQNIWYEVRAANADEKNARVLGSYWVKAIRVMKDPSVDVDESLGNGLKIRSFYNCIIDPDSQTDVVIDRHMWDAAYAGTDGPIPVMVDGVKGDEVPDDLDVFVPDEWPPGKPSSIQGRKVGGPYALIADAVREATADWNAAHPDRPLSPLEAQAIIWCKWGGSDGSFADEPLHNAGVEKRQIAQRVKSALKALRLPLDPEPVPA